MTEGFAEEEKELLVLKIRMKSDHFEKFELLFRQFCNDPETTYDYDLRMSHKSIKRGMKRIYGGKDNDHLATLIFNYFSRGMKNYLVKFSQFMYSFIFELDLD